ncbi:hypothetical protein TRAPUB_13351 [Trametes pubescens]|uniref:Uncharacterized protein n=1 Tax=Trametes pubescens TaxID=154538 RepID=A0A1M2VRB7_TRAPU|nr:hypothetical protein TRAPUB_13351 [Trametes pubescens]
MVMRTHRACRLPRCIPPAFGLSHSPLDSIGVPTRIHRPIPERPRSPQQSPAN